MPLTLQECIDLGVLLTQEQIDFFRHPVDRPAVAVFGVPDPDRLYIAGPDGDATIYQFAEDGEGADADGYRACVLPLVIRGGAQADLVRSMNEWLGTDGLEHLPVVYGTSEQADWMWRFVAEEIPIPAAAWDVWPIEEHDITTWSLAAMHAYEESKLPLIHELIDLHMGNTEWYGDKHDKLQDEQIEIGQKIRRLLGEHPNTEPTEVPGVMALDQRYAALNEELSEAMEEYFSGLEQEVLHPRTGEIDAQIPPVRLPSEQATIWASLQRLSWRNWTVLKKQSGMDTDALYGGRFVEANRRLCPWY